MVAHRRGPWSQHEDSWLINLVHRNGPHNWVRISQEIGTRSPKQCRERYHQNLKPTLNHEPITAEEGLLIERLVREMGKRWAEIARQLNGRSDNAVKNWWNGGQNRRKRNPERNHQAIQPAQNGYHYLNAAQPLSPHDDESPHHMQHHLPPPSMSRESSEYYSQSRRPSLNPSMGSPHTLKLPQPYTHEPYPGTRPQPLELQPCGPHSGARGRGFETPMPSPSAFSVVSADGAPSLVTDTGSESRSPRGSPLELTHTLAPLIGGRDERKNSCTRYVPHTGFAVEDDYLTLPYPQYKRRASVQLPPIHHTEPVAPVFREPDYRFRSERPQLLTQPAPQLVHHHTLSRSAPLPTGLSEQRPLPAFHTIAEPSQAPQSASPRTASPSSRQLPSPFARPSPTQANSESKSAPVSPRNETRDSRMNLSNIC